MAIVSFWGPRDEETGQTLAISAIATYLGVERNYKILVLSTKYKDETFESCFWEPDRNKELKKVLNENKSDLSTGIEGLAKAVASNKITPENITNYTKVVFKGNRLEILETVKNDDYEEYLKIRSMYKQIIQTANKFYDLVFVDLDKGLEEEFIKEILGISHLVVMTIVQKIKTIDAYNDLKNNNELFKNKAIIPVIGKYDQFSKYNSKNVARYLGEKKEFSVIPYCTLFCESSEEGKLPDYFIKFRNIEEPDRNATFIKGIKETGSAIIYKLQELQMRM